MKPMKFKKISDEDNVLGFDEIIILNSRVAGIAILPHMSWGDNEVEGKAYEYEYEALIDENFHIIAEGDWEYSAQAYQFVGFV